MKTIFNAINCTAYLYIIGLACIFISCDKDEMRVRYFECKFNEEEYKTYPSPASFERKAEPVLTIKVDKSTINYNFYTTISPKDLSGDYTTYFLSFKIHCEEPLKIGESYFIPEVSEEVNHVAKTDIEPILNDYVSLSISGEFDSFYGSGIIKMIEYNDEESWYKGIVEFEFDLPIEKGGIGKKSTLKGEFCAVEY